MITSVPWIALVMLAPASGQEPLRALPAKLTGRLLNDAGEPVPDCEISLCQLIDGALDLRRVDVTRTNGLGSFTLAGDALLESYLGIDFEGHPSVRAVMVTLIAGETLDLGDITRPATATLRGRVLDEDGTGLEGARIRVLEQYFGDYFSRANWHVLPWIDDQLFEYRSGDLVLESPRSNPRILAVDDPLMNLLRNPPLQETTTDAEGEYSLEVFQPGPAIVLADHPGTIGAEDVAIVENAQAATAPDIRLRSGRTLSGLVRADGVPCEGVRVWVAGVRGPDEVQRRSLAHDLGSTGPDGRIEVRGLADEVEECWVLVQWKEGGPFWLQLFDAAAPFTVDLPMPRSLSIRVAGPDGAPIAGAVAKVWSEHGRSSLSPVSGTDAEGRLSIEGVWPEPGVLVVRAGDHGWAEIDFGSDPAALESLDITLQEAARWRIRAYDPRSNQPIEGAVLTLRRGSTIIARTDEHGFAELSRNSLEGLLLFESSVLVLRHPAFADASLLLSRLLACPPDEILEFPLENAHRLIGAIQVHGAPPPWPTLIELDDEGSEQSFASRTALVNSAGVFEVSGLPEGVLSFHLRPTEPTLNVFGLRFYGPNDPPSRFDGTLLVGPEPVTRCEIDATPMAERALTLAGVVRIQEQPTGGICIELHSTDHRSSIVTDEEGRFRFESLPGGDYSYAVSWYGEQTTSPIQNGEFFLVESEQSFDLDLDATLLSLAPKFEDGEPAWDVHLWLRRQGAMDEYAAWGKSGSSAFAQFLVVNSKRVQVYAYRFDMGLSGQWIDLPPPRPGTQTVTLLRCVPCAGTIEFLGEVPDGDLWALTFVLQTTADGNSDVAVDCTVLVPPTNPRFDASDIVPGTYTLTLTAPRGATLLSSPFRVERTGSTDLVVQFPKDRESGR